MTIAILPRELERVVSAVRMITDSLGRALDQLEDPPIDVTACGYVCKQIAFALTQVEAINEALSSVS